MQMTSICRFTRPEPYFGLNTHAAENHDLSGIVGSDGADSAPCRLLELPTELLSSVILYFPGVEHLRTVRLVCKQSNTVANSVVDHLHLCSELLTTPGEDAAVHVPHTCSRLATRFPALRKLTLKRFLPEVEHIPWAVLPGSHTRLQELSLEEVDNWPHGRLPALFSTIAPTLKTLHMGVLGGQQLTTLQQLYCLNQLSLNFSGVDQPVLPEQLAELSTLTGLSQLAIHNSVPIPADQLAGLSNLPGLAHLSWIDSWATTSPTLPTPEDRCASLAPLTQLKCLELRAPFFVSGDLRCLSTLTALTSLSLRSESTKVAANTFTALASKLQLLQELQLECVLFEMAERVEHAFPALTRLRFKDSGTLNVRLYTIISHLLPLPRLVVLEVASLRVRPHLLGLLAKQEQLEELALVDCPLRPADPAAPHLLFQSLVKLPRLRSLALRSTTCLDRCLLHQLLPGCAISFEVESGEAACGETPSSAALVG